MTTQTTELRSQPYWTEEAAQAIHVVTAPEPTADHLLHAWILRDPSSRTITRLAREEGRCVVELRGLRGDYRSETQMTWDSAIRTCLMVAMLEGDR